jgi:hypothetical protein
MATMRVTWRQIEDEPYELIARLVQSLTWADAIARASEARASDANAG